MGSSKTYCLMSILCLIGGKVPQILDKKAIRQIFVSPCVLPIFEHFSLKIFARAVPTLLLRWCRPWYFIPASQLHVIAEYCPPSPRHLATLASCVFWKCGVVQLQLNWYHLSAGEICSRNFSPGFFSAEVWQHNAHKPSPAQHIQYGQVWFLSFQRTPLKSEAVSSEIRGGVN